MSKVCCICEYPIEYGHKVEATPIGIARGWCADVRYPESVAYAAEVNAKAFDSAIDSGNHLVPFVDSEIAGRLQIQFENLGLRFRFNERVAKMDASDQRVTISLPNGERPEFELALIAAGRQSNVQGVEQARTAIAHAFNFQYPGSTIYLVPMAIYTVPDIAMVGLTEDACKEKKITYLVGRAYYEKNPRGLIIGDRSGMVKLVFSPHDKKLMGVHHIGKMSSELVHIGTQVMERSGTIDDFRETIYNYPTPADLYKYAAYDGIGLWRQWLREQGQQNVALSAM